MIPAAPTVFALEGGRTFTMWDDPDRFAAEIAKSAARSVAGQQQPAPWHRRAISTTT